MKCNASHIGIRAMLSQGGRLIAYLSENLKGARKRYYTYDTRFYGNVHALMHSSHYLSQKDLLLYLDHTALQYLNTQRNLSRRHGSQALHL